GEPAVSPPKTPAAGPKTPSPDRAEAGLLGGGGCDGGDGSPRGHGQAQDDVYAASAGVVAQATATASPLVPSRDSSTNTPPRVLVSGDDGKGGVAREAPWTPLSLSPVAFPFPATSEEVDRGASSRQVAAGQGDAVQRMLSSGQQSSDPLDASNVRGMATSSEAFLGSREDAEEAEELAAIEERLWTGWDVLLAEYHAAVALAKSRRNRDGVIPATSVIPAQENPTVFGRFDDAAAAVRSVAMPTAAMMLATHSVSRSGGQEDAPAFRVNALASSPPMASAVGTGTF
ncbi:unnamed protein product, partial [Laminaria digitata]